MKTIKIVLGMLSTNCYIIYDEITKQAALIDPAADFPRIKSIIDDLNINIKYIIVTHAHCDHINAVDECKKYTDAKICIGVYDEKSYNDGNLNLCNYFQIPIPDSKPDITLNDSDIIMLGDNKITVIETPGHTKGSISLHYDNNLISGDTLFYESVGRTDFPTGSSFVLLTSIKDKLFSLCDDTIVYPGHGDSTTIGHEKKNNMFVW